MSEKSSRICSLTFSPTQANPQIETTLHPQNLNPTPQHKTNPITLSPHVQKCRPIPAVRETVRTRTPVLQPRSTDREEEGCIGTHCNGGGSV